MRNKVASTLQEFVNRFTGDSSLHLGADRNCKRAGRHDLNHVDWVTPAGTD